jgi:methionyl-tRNA synthetase
MITFEEFKKLDLRVAEIVSAKDHPDADKLTVLEIDLGGERRTIVAGIRGHYENDALVGKQIVVLANLQPAKLRGIESNGMLLAATDGDRVVCLAPDSPVAPGSGVS